MLLRVAEIYGLSKKKCPNWDQLMKKWWNWRRREQETVISAEVFLLSWDANKRASVTRGDKNHTSNQAFRLCACDFTSKCSQSSKESARGNQWHSCSIRRAMTIKRQLPKKPPSFLFSACLVGGKYKINDNHNHTTGQLLYSRLKIIFLSSHCFLYHRRSCIRCTVFDISLYLLCYLTVSLKMAH